MSQIKLTNNVLNSIGVDDVRSVYSGRRGCCCCGCSGTHRYASKHADEASKDRGYELEAKEVNDRQVKSIITKVKNNFDELTSDGYVSSNNAFGTHVALFHGNRLWVLYLTKLAHEKKFTKFLN